MQNFIFTAGAAALFAVIYWIKLKAGGERTTALHRIMLAFLAVLVTLIFKTEAEGWTYILIGVCLVLGFNKYRNPLALAVCGAVLCALSAVLELARTGRINAVITGLSFACIMAGWPLGKLIIKLSPKIKRNVGVFIKKGEGYKRKSSDSAGIKLLAVIVAAASLAQGMGTAVPFSYAVYKDKGDAQTMSECVYLIDADTGEELFSKNSDKRTAPASTAKILTALVVLEYCEMDENVTAGDEVRLVAADASRAQVYIGDTLNIEQLLTALLLPSGNDAAYVLAAYTGRKILNDNNAETSAAIEAFVEEMNSKASQIGAADSVFKSPDGYDSKGQYTTAEDMVKIAGEFVKSDKLMEIAGQYSKYDIWTGGKEVSYYNTNEMLNPDSIYYMDCVTGIKTGTSDLAGACLISSAKINSKTYICAVMGGTEEERFTDTAALYGDLMK